MTNKIERARLEDLLELMQKYQEATARIHRQRAELIGRASAAGGRVTVAVNADGVVIETLFSPAVEELSYDEIAKAVTRAVQQAVTEVRRRSAELVESTREHRPGIGEFADLVPSMPDLTRMFSVPEISTEPPGSRSRPPMGQDSGSEGAERSGVLGSSW